MLYAVMFAGLRFNRDYITIEEIIKSLADPLCFKKVFTSLLLRFIHAYVLYVLSFQDKLVEELDRVLHDDEPVTTKVLGELKYLERVIKESLRLYPSAPFIMRTLSEDLQIGTSHTSFTSSF